MLVDGGWKGDFFFGGVEQSINTPKGEKDTNKTSQLAQNTTKRFS